MYNTKSLSEIAFLNPTYLHYLNPPEYAEQIVYQPSKSVIETLTNLEFNPYSNTRKGNTHQFLKPLRSVARVVYSLCVAIIASLGCIYHAGFALKNIATYAYKKLFNNSDAATENFKRAKIHSICMLTDFCTTIQGVGAVVIMALMVRVFVNECFFGEIDAGLLVFGLGVAASSGLCVVALGGFDPQTFISTLIGNSKTRIGMYLSLRLRNDLGLVAADGGILPHNNHDNIYFTEYYNTITFTNKDRQTPNTNLQKLIDICGNFEYVLINQVVETNIFLKQNNLKEIEFTFPFNGSQLAKAVQAQFKNIQTLSVKHKRMIEELSLSQRKINIMHKTIKQICEMTVNGSFLNEFFHNMTKQPTFTYFKPDSYIQANTYKNYFKTTSSYENRIDKTHEDLTSIFNTDEVTAVNPSKEPFNSEASIYNKFKYKVEVAKYQLTIEHQSNISLHELLFLEKDYDSSKLSKQFYHISRFVHPDKNQNSPESTCLFVILQKIRDRLESEI